MSPSIPARQQAWSSSGVQNIPPDLSRGMEKQNTDGSRLNSTHV
ncbi:hypothetical protein E2C01_043348 [Portunus trituberculatus]|uniref:Uncharacterized protein n=1 Tax=Portunus trituberculatus TaxID=210409 RepID=A0A5B7FX31_PORTR|nr:hypothetical protein [Portunus trituberculatus]